jgi:8-oxo-dGTP pyrophosphatase MutT (NUDIX family)
MAVVRHFTTTGFVVHDDRMLLHWHRKVKMWLPPGGHIDDNEDPVQAVLREVLEETGVTAEVVPTSPAIALDYPQQVYPPFTIMIEDIDDPVQGFHHHIDMIYFCRLVGPAHPLNEGWLWVDREHLEKRLPIETDHGPAVPPPEDVALLAAHAFRVVGGG